MFLILGKTQERKSVKKQREDERMHRSQEQARERPLGEMKIKLNLHAKFLKAPDVTDRFYKEGTRQYMAAPLLQQL